MKNRFETNLDQVRALIAVWRMTGIDEAYALIRATQDMLADERAWYESWERPMHYPERSPWKVRLAFWLLQRQKTHPWRRAWWIATRWLRKNPSASASRGAGGGDAT